MMPTRPLAALERLGLHARTAAGSLYAYLRGGPAVRHRRDRASGLRQRPASIAAILIVASFVGLVAAGQTFVVLIGGIDLSVPWVLNGAAILLVTSSLGQDGRALYALVADARHGAAAGLVNGVGIAFLGVPAVVMTLAMNGIMEGLTLGLSGGMTCQACASYAPPVVQAAVHGAVLGVPAAVILWVGVIAIVSFVLSLTTFGRSTYAIGNNRAGELSRRRQRPLRHDAALCAERIFRRARRHPAGRLRRPGLARHGDPVSLPVDRRGGHRRRLHPRRPRPLSRRGGRRGHAWSRWSACCSR